MKSGSKNYSDLLGYNISRSPRHYKNGLSGLKASPRAALTSLGNGSDKDSISGRSRKPRTRQAILRNHHVHNKKKKLNGFFFLN